MKFQCPYCEALLDADKSGLGKQIKCPGCGGMMIVPGPDGPQAVKQKPEEPPKPDPEMVRQIETLQKQITAKNSQIEESIARLKKQTEDYNTARKKDQDRIKDLTDEVKDLKFSKSSPLDGEFEIIAPPRTVSSQMKQFNMAAGSEMNTQRQYAGIPPQQTGQRSVPHSSSLATTTEPMPVLDAFQKFLEAERKRARNRMVLTTVFLSIISLALIGGAIAVGTFFLNRVADDIESVKGVVSSTKIESDNLEKTVDKTLDNVRSESGRMMEDITREKQSLSSMQSDFNDKIKTIERMSKTMTRLEMENMRLMEELKKMRENVPAPFLDELDALAKRIDTLSRTRDEEKRTPQPLPPESLPLEDDPLEIKTPSENIKVSMPGADESDDTSVDLILPIP